MSGSGVHALDLSREFFDEIVFPAIRALSPRLLEIAAFGRFGYGSECLRLDDEFSRDHHWSPRVDVLVPEVELQDIRQTIGEGLERRLPSEFRGYPLVKGHVGVPGLSFDSLEGFLKRTIGRTTPPKRDIDWLNFPEEDIVHVVNGEVWHDGPGNFSEVRRVLKSYYPDLIWKKRIARWCRYASGMGAYALQRAILRGNRHYLYWTFSRALKMTMELGFLLNRSYFPYDKWLYPMFRKLSDPVPSMLPLAEEALNENTVWIRKLALIEGMHSLIDQRLVELQIIPPHPEFRRSETSGYRILEHAYGEICRTLPQEILETPVVMDQCYLETFHDGWVARLPIEEWDEILNLQPAE